MGLTEKGVAGGLATLDTSGTLTAGQMPAAYVNSGNASIGGTLAVTGASTLTGNAALGGTLAVTGASTLTGNVTTAGDLIVGTVTKGIKVKEGTNATMGVATLSSGAVVVSTTKVSATSRILVSIQSLGTVTVPKAIGVTARTAATSFTITSADATDTSVVAWVIVEPAP